LFDYFLTKFNFIHFKRNYSHLDFLIYRLYKRKILLDKILETKNEWRCKFENEIMDHEIKAFLILNHILINVKRTSLVDHLLISIGSWFDAVIFNRSYFSFCLTSGKIWCKVSCSILTLISVIKRRMQKFKQKTSGFLTEVSGFFPNVMTAL